MRGGMRKGARSLFVALAVLSLLAFRPICDVLLAAPGNAEGAVSVAQDAHGSDRSAACCSSIGEGAPLAPISLTASSRDASGAQLALAAALFFLVGTEFLPFGSLRSAGAPPRTRPYHARSARIQR